MRRVLCLAVAVFLCSTASLSAQIAELIRKVPPSANAILLVDIQAVHSSPIGVEKGWKTSHERDFASSPVKVPPDAKLAVIATSLSPNRNFESDWELSLMTLSEPFPARAIARAEGGYVDRIRSVDAVWSPVDAYIVPLPSNELAIQTPANRQQISRWLEFAGRNQTSQLSTYLVKATESLSKATPFVMAIDLTDVVQPHRIRESLAAADWASASEVPVETIAGIVETIQGATIRISLGSKAEAAVEIDFGKETAPLRPILNQLVASALKKLEMEMPDVQEMKLLTSGTQIVASGPISDVGLRRLASLLEVPTDKFSTLKDAQPGEKPSADTVAYSSQKYFRSVGVLIDDLESTLNKTRDNHAVWFERYAKKIDSLPILNVDEELLGWGAAVAETLRSMALAKRNSGIRSGVRKSSIYGNYAYDYDGYGYYGARSTNSMRSQISMEEQGKANAVRFAGWKGIQDSRAEIRTAMTQKYQVEF